MATFRVGLTGGIGSGKSSVTGLLRQWGITCIDADAISHALTAAHGQAIPLIQAQFGEQMVTAEGALDRAKMRHYVFSHPQAREQLQAILHPLIRQVMQEQDEQSTSPYVVHDIPLLVESYEQYRSRFDRICVLVCDLDTQVARVMARSQWPKERILAIIATQATLTQRLAVADDTIDNGATVSFKKLEHQVYALHQQWLAMARNVSSL